MHYSLIALVVLIGEQNGPIVTQLARVDGEAVILHGDEAAASGIVGTRLVVSTVTVPASNGSNKGFSQAQVIALQQTLF